MFRQENCVRDVVKTKNFVNLLNLKSVDNVEFWTVLTSWNIAGQHEVLYLVLVASQSNDGLVSTKNTFRATDDFFVRLIVVLF